MSRFRPAPASLFVCLLSVLGLLACDNKTCPPNTPCPTPTAGPVGQCANVAGTRNMFWSDSCGRSGNGMIVLAQSGCSVTGAIASLGTFAGTVSGSTFSFTLTFTDPCGGSATGTASINGSAVTGSYSGTQTGAAPCCTAVSGTFSFDYSPTRVPTTPTPTPTH